MFSYSQSRLVLAFSLYQSINALPSSGNLNIQLQRRWNESLSAIYQPTCDHWSVEAKLGDQTLNLLVDTGSSDLWVYSSLVQNPGNHTLYDYGDKPVLQQVPAEGGAAVNATFDISYGFAGSNVKGLVGYETVSLGGAPPVLMNIEIATEVTDEVKKLPCWDGIIGMGFKGLNRVRPQNVNTYLERLLETSKTNPKIKPNLPVFTIDGNPQRSGSKPSFELGHISREKYNGELYYAPVNNKDGWWAVDNITFEAGFDIDHYPGQAIKSKHGMVFDTGGSGLISVQNATAAGYYALIPNARDISNNGSYYFPCKTASGTDQKMPDLKLYLGNGTAIYRASLLGPDTSQIPGTCTGPIQGREIAEGLGNVGGDFFRSHFVVFDYGTPAIQFAPFN
ncbi:MAG: hypothetical protein L6R38_003428 [Xanthoria sp. 2 TBL-2021]|nr:MAG: hypothetical protein L6R38_003428 [Xanthoria sp. 2 TBL-2021]